MLVIFRVTRIKHHIHFTDAMVSTWETQQQTLADFSSFLNSEEGTVRCSEQDEMDDTDNFASIESESNESYVRADEELSDEEEETSECDGFYARYSNPVNDNDSDVIDDEMTEDEVDENSVEDSTDSEGEGNTRQRSSTPDLKIVKKRRVELL